VRARLDAVIAGLRRPTYATVTPREFLTEPSEALRYRGRGLGQDWGTVIHKLLELALEHRGPDGMLSAAFDLEAAAAAGIEESDLEHDHAALAARAVELVRGVMASDIWRRATASPRCYVEVPFTLQVASDQLPAGVDLDAGPGAATPPEPLPTLIRGVIDLVFADAPDATGDAGWTIVDWKTTSAIAESDTTLADHYLPQLRLYARCWAAASCTLPPST
jgi:ATP-dependent exoDNAse (exonuclease V) beta subunit